MADRARRIDSVVRRPGLGVRYALLGAGLMLVAVFGWRFYAGWRIGRVVLETEGTPLLVQVQEEATDHAIGEPFDLVTRAVLELPAGDYRLRVNGTGRLGRTYRMGVNRGEALKHTISIDEGRMLVGEPDPATRGGGAGPMAPIPFANVVAALELDRGKADLIEWSRESLIRRDVVTGQVRWDAFHPATPFVRDRDPARWMTALFASRRHGKLVEPASDLDGDGTGDLLWYFENSAALVALSGKDGSMIWNYVAELDGPGGPNLVGPDVSFGLTPKSHTAGKPAMADVDRDGIPDWFATFIFMGSSDEPGAESAGEAGSGSRRCRRIVVGVSGRSGRPLWTYPVDRAFVEISFDHFKVEPAALVEGRQSNLLAFVENTKWIGLDFPPSDRLGSSGAALSWALRPRQCRFRHDTDLDGDGEPEILTMGPGPDSGQETMRALSIKTGRELWAQTIEVPFDQIHDELPFNGCPLVAELDDDVRPGILVPDAGAMPPRSRYRGLRLVDGRTGATRCRHTL